jgi:hypothetical protein
MTKTKLKTSLEGHDRSQGFTSADEYKKHIRAAAKSGKPNRHLRRAAAVLKRRVP